MKTGATRIRPAGAGDHAGIRAVVEAAFGRPDEADLVDALRAEGASLVELVAAAEDGAVLGHVLFTALGIERPGAGQGTGVRAAALAPLSVRPDAQRQGMGSALVTRGVEDCRRIGVAAVVVLGDPAYYPRLGFRADLAAGLDTPFPGPAFMALELVPGALAAGGRVRYAASFGLG